MNDNLDAASRLQDALLDVLYAQVDHFGDVYAAIDEAPTLQQCGMNTHILPLEKGLAPLDNLALVLKVITDDEEIQRDLDNNLLDIDEFVTCIKSLPQYRHAMEQLKPLLNPYNVFYSLLYSQAEPAA